MSVALCGMMGCGKSTVAKILSAKYNLPLIDTDEIIVRENGEISDIFALKGEEYFRDLESSVIEKICALEGSFVIALGGGAVLREENVRNLKKHSFLIYLRAKEQNLVKRLEKTDDRPLLHGTMSDRVHQILSKRATIYESVADKTIDTDDLTPEEIAKIIGETTL